MLIQSDVINFCKKILDDLDLEEVEAMSLEEVAKKVIEAGLYKDERAVKLFIVEQAISVISEEKVAYPIEYLKEHEEIPEDEKYIETFGLTDDLCRAIQ